MTDTPICDANMHVTEQNHEVVPLHIAQKLERDLIAARTRNEARYAGGHKYTGKPCIHGHSGVRYVSSKICVECAKERSWKQRNEVNK